MLLGERLNAIPAGTRRWVDSEVWHQARKQVLDEIGTELYKTVESTAVDSDRVQHGLMEGRPEEALGNSRLWQALTLLARRRQLPDFSDNSEEREQDFASDDLCELLGANTDPNMVSRALNRLTHSLVLSGDINNPHQFCFTANILPMWSQEEG